ncbi:glycosyltransferase [Phyllobacterium sp. 21LDTY02-6]|uniref:glycosyltransferase n=1 Tax=Phyllobacterium sp. 21LDTY02-6 TaxID=2944903 RepID=UPI002022505E|nr:glycosyltransferase [Phyllobacterium sp. 21LDTY02-6]MCO4316420.1 glycosyltransferase [Phyllobacterium sp. 21LDTY02-6]
MISISVVVPVYSGEAYLERLVDAVAEIRAKWIADDAPFKLLELVFVDDGARDNSPSIIDALGSGREWVKPHHFSRNFGQHPATIAGILKTEGDWVVTMDEDMQHPPSRIEQLLAKAALTQSDVVYANASEAVHESASRDLTSRLYKKTIRYLSGNQNVHLFNSFRLIRGSVARAASAACGHSTYFDMALSWYTQRITAVHMPLKDDRYIQTGKSGYKLKTLLSHARKMLITGQIKALRLGSLFGIGALGVSIVGAAAVLGEKLFYPERVAASGWASLALLILFFSGAIIFLVGIALEYISVLVLHAHGKPLYFIVDRQGDKVLAEYFSSSAAREDQPT